MAMIRKAETHGHTWVEESETSLGISTELHNANTGNCTCTKTGPSVRKICYEAMK